MDFNKDLSQPLGAKEVIIERLRNENEDRDEDT